MAVGLGTKPVSWCCQVLLSPRSMNLTDFCMIPVLLVCVPVCTYTKQLAQTEDNLVGETEENKPTPHQTCSQKYYFFPATSCHSK